MQSRRQRSTDSHSTRTHQPRTKGMQNVREPLRGACTRPTRTVWQLFCVPLGTELPHGDFTAPLSTLARPRCGCSAFFFSCFSFLFCKRRYGLHAAEIRRGRFGLQACQPRRMRIRTAAVPETHVASNWSGGWEGRAQPWCTFRAHPAYIQRRIAANTPQPSADLVLVSTALLRHDAALGDPCGFATSASPWLTSSSAPNPCASFELTRRP